MKKFPCFTGTQTVFIQYAEVKLIMLSARPRVQEYTVPIFDENPKILLNNMSNDGEQQYIPTKYTC